MATKMDSAEKAFEAATLETAAKPVAAPVAPAEAAPAAKAPAPVKTKTVAAKAKPVQKKAAKPAAKKVAPKKAAAKTIAPKAALKTSATAPKPAPCVGVARPNMMLPSAAMTRAAGGTRPAKKSTQTGFHLAPIRLSISAAR